MYQVTWRQTCKCHFLAVVQHARPVCVRVRVRVWSEIVQKDCHARKLNTKDAMDRSRWRKLINDD